MPAAAQLKLGVAGAIVTEYDEADAGESPPQAAHVTLWRYPD
jgi:hypothetical protein